MGIGKTICAIGEYDFFTRDYLAFAKIISDMFQVNVTISFVFYPGEKSDIRYIEMEDEFHDFNKELNYRLTVFLLDCEDSSLENKLKQVNCYELMIPIELEDEKEFLIEFNSYGIFELKYIPYSSAWRFFIEDIVEHNFNLTVFKIPKIRNKYIEVLSCINCKEVVLWTDAYYKTEGMIDSDNEEYKKLSITDVITSLVDVDKVTVYHFADVVNQKKIIKSQSIDYYDVVLLDRFCDNIVLR